MVEDNRKKKEGQEETNATIEWQEKKQSVKRSDPLQPRRPCKKIKIDREEINPRKEGLQKRKVPIGCLEEFQQECKRRRPNFNPAEELESELECDKKMRSPERYQDREGSQQVNKQIFFFSIFSKTNKTLNHEVMFRKSEKAKEKVKAMKKRRKSSTSSLSKSKNGGQDIRSYMNRTKLINSLEVGKSAKDNRSATKPKIEDKLSPACISKQTEVAQLNSNHFSSDLDGIRQDQLIARISDDKAGESGVVDWEPGLKGGEGESTAVHCCIASEVVVPLSSEQAHFECNIFRQS